MASDKCVEKLVKELGKTAASSLVFGRKISGVNAWKILDMIRSIGRVLYEDEEIDEHECYIIIISLCEKLYYVLYKREKETIAFISNEWRHVEKALTEYRECVKA